MMRWVMNVVKSPIDINIIFNINDILIDMLAGGGLGRGAQNERPP